MRRLALALLLAAFAAPAWAGLKTCNPTLVTQGVCRNPSERVRCLPYAVNDAADVEAALAASVGWTATITCGIDAIVAELCTEGQLNTVVTNPETQAAAAARAHREFLLGVVNNWRSAPVKASNASAAAAALAAVPVPDIGE